MRKLLLLSLCIIPVLTFADHKTDSLLTLLRSAKEDSVKVRQLAKVFITISLTGDYAKADSLNRVTISLAEKLNYKRGLAVAYHQKGDLYWYQGNYTEGLRWQQLSQAIHISLNNKQGIAATYTSMGNIYCDEGNLSDALSSHLQALRIDQDMNNSEGMGDDYNNISNVYQKMNNYPEALKNLQMALKIDQERKDNYGIALDYGNLGVVNRHLHKFAEALSNQKMSLKLHVDMNDQVGIANAYSNIGNLYLDQGKYAEALEPYQKSLKINQDIGNKGGIANEYINLGSLFVLMKNYALAKENLDKGLAIAKEIGNKYAIEIVYQELASYDSTTGNSTASLKDYKLFILYRDSVVNEENTKKTVQAQMQYDFDRKEAAVKAEQDKKDAITEQDKKKQAVVRNAFIAGFTLMLALAFFIFRGYREKQKANTIIAKQKEEVVIKNKEILDSITYAKRLQDAILPPVSLIKQYLPDTFLLYKPKDIVAGDFYWMWNGATSLPAEQAGRHSSSGENQEGIVLIAAADCTGHGVPGALVSVVCSNALNRAVKEFGITEPGNILNKVRDLVLETFEKSESDVKDGMDISICAINTKTLEIKWSGANNPLWYLNNGEMHEITADKQPIGKHYNEKNFTTHVLNLKKGDMLYLFTDGYADQFGGPKGKKFKYKQMLQSLHSLSQFSMDEQKEQLNSILESWKGSLEQVDDILVIGIKV